MVSIRDAACCGSEIGRREGRGLYIIMHTCTVEVDAWVYVIINSNYADDVYISCC